ncbi:MAG: hypothetical protein JWN84_3243 [Nocardioides sp.]|nr:hypothetical protein [Nocardioides sp.]
MVRVVALGAALVGGVGLVAHLFVDAGVLWWTGLALLGVAVAVVGAGLARVPWLAAITAAGAVVLAWAVLETARNAVPDPQLGAVVGGIATLVVAVTVLRRPPAGHPTTRPGNHRS